MAAREPAISSVECVDLDPAACDLSARLIRTLGLEHRIALHPMSAQEYGYWPEDLVLCASLIQGKAELYQLLFQKEVETFLVRDAEGAYCYLYEPSPLPDPAHYKALGQTIPTSKCINTTRLFRRRGGVSSGIVANKSAINTPQVG